MSDNPKPWMTPIQYNDEPERPSLDETEGRDEPEPEREHPDRPRPARSGFVSLDTEPMQYRSGDPNAVFGVEDIDEALDDVE